MKFSFNECNAICLWVDWILDGRGSSATVVSTGPVRPVEIGKFVEWDRFTSQGVYFLQQTFDNPGRDMNRIDWNMYFNKKYGVISNFKVKYEWD